MVCKQISQTLLLRWNLNNHNYVPFIIIIITTIIIIITRFLLQFQLMVFHWGLGDSKSPHVPETLLRILANLNFPSNL